MENKKYYLLIWEGHWADEMDLDGHVVLSEEKYGIFEEAVNRTEYLHFGVGTNEEIEYFSMTELHESFEVKVISETQYQTLKDLGLLSMGFASSFVEQVIDDVDGEGNE